MESKFSCKSVPFQHVTVFQDQAQVTRRVRLEDPQIGLNHVTLSDLPSSCINTDSIMVSCSGSAILRDVSFVKSEVTVNKEDIDNNDEVKSLNQTIHDMRSQIAILKSQQDILEQLVATHRESSDGGLTFSQYMSIINDYLDRQSTIFTKVQELETNLHDKEQELLKCIDRLRSSKSNSVRVVLDVQDTSSFYIDISYHVRNCSWQPCYDIRVDSKNKDLQLSYHALVRQRTGEDWKQTSLSLSTAKPSQGGAAPTQPQSYLSYSSGRRHYETHSLSLAKKSRRSRAMPMMSALSMAPRSAPPPQAEFAMMMNDDFESDESSSMAEVVTASVKGTVTAATFTIDRQTTVKSDFQEHKSTIAMLPLPCQIRHYVVPSLSTKAFFQARAVNDSNLPILASSRVSVYLDGGLIGSSDIKSVAPSDTFRFFLGPDPNIKVSFNALPVVKNTSRGFISKSVQLFHEFTTVVENQGDIPTIAAVVMQNPKSSSDEVTLKLVDPNPDSLKTDKDMNQITASEAKADRSDDVQYGGGLSDSSCTDYTSINPATNHLIFTVQLEPKDKKQLRVCYTVDHSSKISIYESEA